MAWPTQTFAQGFRDYGDIYTVGNPLYGKEILISSPELIRQVLTAEPDTYYAGEPNQPLSPLVGNRSVLLLDGPGHRRERKLLAPPFHGERLNVYADVMRDATLRAIERFPRGRRFSILPHMQRLTFEVILDNVLGVRDKETIDHLHNTVGDVVERAQSPLGMLWLLPAFQKDLGPLTGWAALKRGIEASDQALFDVIAKAREANQSNAGPARTDVLSLLLSARDEDGNPMTDQELRDELVTLLLAGHETSATALAWMIDVICRRPELLARIQEELKSTPHPGPWPYLDATIKEVLRLYPVGTLIVRRAKRDVVLGGYDIPAESTIVLSIYTAQRHPKAWEDPEALKPERFLNKKPDPYAWMPFGGGDRRCVGMAFALLELRVVLATMLSRVRFELPDPPAKVKLRSFLFAPARGTRVVVGMD